MQALKKLFGFTQKKSTDTVGAPYTAEEYAAVKKNLLNKIASTNHTLTKVTEHGMLDAMLGAVIAAPAMQSASFSQDYYFYWVRDGAIAMYEIVHFYKGSQDLAEKNEFKTYLLNYIEFVKKIQAQPPLNGVPVLGDPKFNVDGTLWTGVWSRPQNDGPAYQAITLTHIANILLDEGQDAYVLEHIYNPHDFQTILKANLEYTASHWNEETVGPWEELRGYHFSVQAIQRRALYEGALLAKRLNDLGAAEYYHAQSQHIQDAMAVHWDHNLGYYFETLKLQDNRGGGINAAVIAGLIYTALEDPIPEDPYCILSERALSTLYYQRYMYEGFYQVNVIDASKDNQLGPLIGRYPNDTYDGNQFLFGNPWFLCSSHMATAYYLVAYYLLIGKSVKVSLLVRQFLSQIVPDIVFTDGQVLNNQLVCFKDVVTNLIAAADGVLRACKAHSLTYEDGSMMHMSEQISRSTGEQVSAPDLSWSYAAWLRAVYVRNHVMALL